MTRIALATGYISQNVGNGFFELGAAALLERAVGRENLFFVQDVPANWTLWRKSNGVQQNWWNVISRLDVDAFVFQGPTLTGTFETIWDEVLGSLRRANIEPIMLSIGFSKFTQFERDQAVRMIRKHGVSTIFTRDERTFDYLEPVGATYSGIDSAFFVPWAYSPPKITGGPFLLSCFEATPEPLDLIHRIVGENAESALQTPRRSGVFSKRHSSAYASQLLRRSARTTSIGPFEVVRPVHRTNPPIHARMFKDANSIATDEPFTYLNLYANTAFTVTDRVHAAVATIAYGNKAMLLSETPRRSLLERVGVTFPMREPMSVDPAWLEAQRISELDALSKALGVRPRSTT